MALTTRLVLICDMQAKFRYAIHEFDYIEVSITCLVDLCKLLLVPIIVTTQNSAKLGQTIPSITSRLPERTLCHDKSLFSMLEKPVMDEIHRVNPDQIVIVGIETQICISQTALALRSKGYRVTVLADAVSSSSAWGKGLALQRLRSNGVDVTSLESWLFESTVSSNHAKFRELSSVIKQYNTAKRNEPKSAL